MEQQYEVIAEGLGSDLQAAEDAESRLVKDGDQVELRLYVNEPLSKDQIVALQSALLSNGMVMTEPVAYDSGVVVIRYVKTTPAAAEGIGFPLLIVLSGIGLVAGVVFAWQMARQSSTILNNPLLIFAAVALAVVYFMMKTPDPKEEPR